MENDTLTRWIVGIVAAGIIGILVFLTKWVFKGVFDRLDANDKRAEERAAEQNRELEKVLVEMRGIAREVGENRIQTALLHQELGQVKQEQAALRERVNGLADYWRQQWRNRRDKDEDEG